MKKRILILSTILAALCFTAFAFNNKYSSKKNEKVKEIPETKTVKNNTEPDFIYDIGPRFNSIKKEDLHNITSIHSFIKKDDINTIPNIKSVELIVIENDLVSNKKEIGNSLELTNKQLALLKSFDYSSHFSVKINGFSKDNLIKNTFSPYFTIVPETQAEYIYGKKALVKYFKDNTRTITKDIPEDKLKPAKLYFTVTKYGTIKHVKLDRSCGYPEIDNLMVNLINTTPGGWIPATNTKQETVNQELVVSFGLLGC
ncbi:hypothetical protein [Algibacter sp. PT7-4]|uniref:hypothetical protein n=1 Tax=Algibacter ulvanivorans TaxID=3400999 RepID=UPI003AAFA0E5